MGVQRSWYRGDTGPQHGVDDGAVFDGVSGNRQVHAGLLDDLAARVGQNRSERPVGPGSSHRRGRDVDPTDRLGFGLDAAHRPVEEVLEGPGHVAGVFGGADEQGVGVLNLPAQLDHLGGERVVIVVGIEMGERGQA